VIELEPAGPPDDYARVLYDRLRQADRLAADVLLVVAPPSTGVGAAVRDRLRRAAASTGYPHPINP
jgi:L-threonylcarbamoyladenylate synthase